MDQPVVSRLIVQNGGIQSASGAPFTGIDPATNAPRPIPVIASLTCPDDSNNSGVPGGLSYAANAGYINASSWTNINPGLITASSGPHGPDLGIDAHDSTKIAWTLLSPPNPSPGTTYTIGEADQAIARATGVFWRVEADGFQMSLDYIQRNDGASNSLLFAENINSGHWADVTLERQDLQTGFIAFGVSVTLTSTAQLPLYPDQSAGTPTGQFGTSNGYLDMPPTYALTDVGAPGNPNPIFFSGPPGWSSGQLGSTQVPHPPDDANIDSNLLTATNGWVARPSSNHPNLVLVCFVDGHALPLSRDIDIRVYTRTLSPAGKVYGQPADGAVK
jgi:hypothetical protein